MARGIIEASIRGWAAVLLIMASPQALAAGTGAAGGAVPATGMPATATLMPGTTAPLPATTTGRFGGNTMRGVGFGPALPPLTTGTSAVTSPVPLTVTGIPPLTTRSVVPLPLGGRGTSLAFPGATGVLATPTGAGRLAPPGSSSGGVR
jgi:hypothetical protein